MNRFLFLFILSFSFFSLKAQSIKNLYPGVQPAPDLSPAKEARYQQAVKAFEKQIEQGEGSLSPKEKDCLKEFPDIEVYGGVGTLVGDGCSWYCGGGPDTVHASSQLNAYGDIQYTGQNAHDLSLKTAWVEGVDGNGVGEYLDYVFAPGSPRINQIMIYNGYTKTPKAWQNNGRVKNLRMSINGKPYAMLHLQDARGEQGFSIDPPVGNIDSEEEMVIRFEIMDIYPGAKYKDVAITEIYFDGIDVHCFAAGSLVKMANGTEQPIETLKKGDWVESYDPERQCVDYGQVKEYIAVKHCQLVAYQFQNGTEIIATPDHPLWVAGKGWASMKPSQSLTYLNYNQVALIQPNDYLVSQSGYLKIQKIRHIHAPQMTYTIGQIVGAKTFWVNGILVGTESLLQP